MVPEPGELAAGAPWLEVRRGWAPILLIAPHGGHADSACRGHPRVNDLHTADISRQLAALLDAHALINIGLDRNRLDCNRLDQLQRDAPWFLGLIAERVKELTSGEQRLLVVVVHGWNIVQPRVDLGLGARLEGKQLRPVASGSLTASRAFIAGPLQLLRQRLMAAGIIPTLGLRYPAGGRHNLLQMFSARHLESASEDIKGVAQIAARGAIDAVQIELSVALRWPGAMRETAIELLAKSLGRPQPTPFPVHRTGPLLEIIDTPRPRANKPVVAPAAPQRFGLEAYDPVARIGVMASIDLGTPGGARVILMIDSLGIVTFTAEGAIRASRHRIALGPVNFVFGGDGTLRVHSRGPALVIPDRAGYLRFEQAFAQSQLCHDVALDCVMTPQAGYFGAPMDKASMLPDGGRTTFGTVEGEVRLDQVRRPLKALGRSGVALLTPILQAFDTRRSLWACWPSGEEYHALEARLIEHAGAASHRKALAYFQGQPVTGHLNDLRSAVTAFDRPPGLLEVEVALPNRRIELAAHPQTWMALSRPGPHGARILTSMGFATVESDEGQQGIGMFEHSLTIAPAPPSPINSSGQRTQT